MPLDVLDDLNQQLTRNSNIVPPPYIYRLIM